MKTVWTGLVAVALVAAVVVVPVLVAVGRRNDVRHFHVVREGVRYRSAQPLVRGLARPLPPGWAALAVAEARAEGALATLLPLQAQPWLAQSLR